MFQPMDPSTSTTSTPFPSEGITRCFHSLLCGLELGGAAQGTTSIGCLCRNFKTWLLQENKDVLALPLDLIKTVTLDRWFIPLDKLMAKTAFLPLVHDQCYRRIWAKFVPVSCLLLWGKMTSQVMPKQQASRNLSPFSRLYEAEPTAQV